MAVTTTATAEPFMSIPHWPSLAVVQQVGYPLIAGGEVDPRM